MSWKLGSFCFKLVFPHAALLLLKSPHFNTLSKTLIADCLRSFTDLEELDETELYMCHKCKKKQKSTKKFWIQKLPKVSDVFHLGCIYGEDAWGES